MAAFCKWQQHSLMNRSRIFDAYMSVNLACCCRLKYKYLNICTRGWFPLEKMKRKDTSNEINGIERGGEIRCAMYIVTQQSYHFMCSNFWIFLCLRVLLDYANPLFVITWECDKINCKKQLIRLVYLLDVLKRQKLGLNLCNDFFSTEQISWFWTWLSNAIKIFHRAAWCQN